MTYLKRSNGAVKFLGALTKAQILSLNPGVGDVAQVDANIDLYDDGNAVFARDSLIMFNGNNWVSFSGLAQLNGVGEYDLTSSLTLPIFAGRVYVDSTAAAVTVTLPPTSHHKLPDIVIVARKLVNAITVVPNTNDAYEQQHINGNPSYSFVTERDAITLTQGQPNGWAII